MKKIFILFLMCMQSYANDNPQPGERTSFCQRVQYCLAGGQARWLRKELRKINGYLDRNSTFLGGSFWSSSDEYDQMVAKQAEVMRKLDHMLQKK